MVGPPSEDDLLNIVNVWYPKLNTLAGKLIGITFFFLEINCCSGEKCLEFTCDIFLSYHAETFKIVNALSASQLGSVTVERFSLRYSL